MLQNVSLYFFNREKTEHFDYELEFLLDKQMRGAFTIKTFLAKAVTKSFSHFLLSSFVDQYGISSKLRRSLSVSTDPYIKEINE